jgi:FtsP/CotA-like multicopper oxidase with cupredoxin domain
MKRRDFLTLSIKSAMAAGFTSAIPASLLFSHSSHAAILAAGLSDPAAQPLFTNLAPNAMSAGFKFVPNKFNRLTIQTAQTTQMTGLVSMKKNGKTKPVPTTVWGYGDSNGVSWPGKTIERHVSDAPLEIVWENNLTNRGGKPLPHLLPIDTSLHWAYSLPGYEQFSIEKNGVPLVPHVHGGKNDSPFDGNPEYFFSPGGTVKGPRFVTHKQMFGGPDWNDAAGMMWYHDHTLGITRMNVYAGLAGFFALRDDNDTGKALNPAGLPADPYELGYAVQDRMFRNTGDLFYSAFPGEPFYDDFIDDAIRALLPPGGGPTALAEFFGDHMLVNGVIWPKTSVEQRQYRVRFLNGTDSRFMRLKLKVIPGGASNGAATNPADGYELPFYIVGSDQSLSSKATMVNEVDFLPGERLDLVVDFKDVPRDSRVIVENVLGDAPFGGDLPGPDDVFPDRRTDRVMAFDVEKDLDTSVMDTAIEDGSALGGGFSFPADTVVARTRKLALFEGSDSIGRLQPLLGTAEQTADVTGATVNGALPWFAPITENPNVGDTEIWEIYNATGDAHPIHVHLVHFEVMNREGFTADAFPQPVAQHDGTAGIGFRLGPISLQGNVRGPDPTEDARRDMVMALPGEVTRIKMTFTKAGRYVWHCHILSHEDHEMMRPFHVGPGPF